MSRNSFQHRIRGYFNLREGRASYEGMRKRIIAGARIDGIHMFELMAAMLIASIGLNVDSTEAVVGAMLICPLMGSVLGLAYGVASVDVKILRQSASGLFAQIVVCLVTSTIYFLISPLSGQTEALVSNSTPTIWDLTIALVGGFAGGLGMSRQQEPAILLSGVAVATALMPPLCSTGYGLALRDAIFAASAFYEFLINVVFIALGAEFVFLMLRVPLHADLNDDGVVTEEEERRVKLTSRVMRRNIVIATGIFVIPCVFISANVVKSTLAENGTVFEVFDQYQTEATTLELKVACPGFVNYSIGSEDSYNIETDTLEQHVIATVVTEEELSVGEKTEAEALIQINVPNLERVDFEVDESAA